MTCFIAVVSDTPVLKGLFSQVAVAVILKFHRAGGIDGFDDPVVFNLELSVAAVRVVHFPTAALRIDRVSGHLFVAGQE